MTPKTPKTKTPKTFKPWKILDKEIQDIKERFEVRDLSRELGVPDRVLGFMA